MLEAQRILVEAALLPAELPNNYTFNKVREILIELDKADSSELSRAIKIVSRLKVQGALAVVIFIKHHLTGAHEVEVDRIAKHEATGESYGVLVYAEGEVPVNREHLPEDVRAGRRLKYNPSNGTFTPERDIE